MGNDLEEIEFDIDILNRINELIQKARLTHSEHLRDSYNKEGDFLRTFLDLKSQKLKDGIQSKLSELLKINKIKLTPLFYLKELYAINNYDKIDSEFVGSIYILEDKFIVLETKDEFICPLFKVRGDKNGQ